jgi:glycerophosphoryl diester phosphodiesterase
VVATRPGSDPSHRLCGGQTPVVGRLKAAGIGTLLFIGVAATMSAAVSTPLIIGHRGAAGHRPEHTLAGYRLAAEMGADYIEPDLVATKDGLLIARHENEIGSTTDAAVKFPDRKRTKTVDDMSITGWFSEDFTLAEIKTLRARERLNVRAHGWDGQFEVPTFDDVIELAQQLGKELHRPIGIYPETKHPTYFRGIGLPLEDRMLAALDRHGWNTAAAPVFIQSFETNLRELRPKTPIKLIQLLEGKVPTDEQLRTIKSYADGIGPNTRLVIPAIADGTLLPPTDLVARAHALGLLVHVWTLRSEPVFLSRSYRGDVGAEYRQFAALGVDGIFTDFPDAAARALKQTFAASGR